MWCRIINSVSDDVQYMIVKDMKLKKDKFKSVDGKIVIFDEKIESQLNQKSKALGISVEELIDRYVKRELFTDDYYVPRKLTREELIEMSKRDVKRDMENGIPPVKHNFDVFVNRWSGSD